jgi:beta-N-acetylhexosaminidase
VRITGVITWVLLLAGTWAGAQAPEAGTPENRARQVLSGLTLEQKVGQLFLVYHSPGEFMAKHGFGGSLVMESMVGDADGLQQSLRDAESLCAVPLLVAMDQEGGEINRLRPLPGFEKVASAEEMAHWPADSLQSYLQPIAEKLRDLGINTNLAPVLDPSVNVDYQKTLMESRQRSFGRDSRSIVPPALAFIEGFAHQNVLCIVKHFPGYVVQENSDLEVAESVANRAALLSYVHPFAACMAEAGGVMMSSILFSMVSEKPAVFDSQMVKLARCGFGDRLVMTDDLWGTALRSWVSGTEVERADYPEDDLRQLTLLAFDAGNDMLMITYPAKAVLMKEILLEAVVADQGRQERLDESVYRILLLKSRLGLI